MPLQAEVQAGRSGTKQQQGVKQVNGSLSKPGSRKEAGSKALLSGSGQKKRKTSKTQQQDTEGRRVSAKAGRCTQKQVRFAENVEDEIPAAHAAMHDQECRREEHPSAAAAGEQSAGGPDVLGGADMVDDLADGASDLADTWEVPNTYPIAPDGCEMVPGVQAPASLMMPPAKPEPGQGNNPIAVSGLHAAPEVAPACRSKRQLSSRLGESQQGRSDGAGAAVPANDDDDDDDDFQEAPGKKCSRDERSRGSRAQLRAAAGKVLQAIDPDQAGASDSMGRQGWRDRRGVAGKGQPPAAMDRSRIEQKSGRKARSVKERPPAQEAITRSMAAAKRAQRKQDGVFARLFAAEAALPVGDTTSSPSHNSAAAPPPRPPSPAADSGGCTQEQQRQPHEVPDSVSVDAGPIAAPAAGPAQSANGQHMPPPGSHVGTASTEHMQDEFLGTSSADFGPAEDATAAADHEVRPVPLAAPAGPKARQAGSAKAARTTFSRASLHHDPDVPPSSETPCGGSGQVCSGCHPSVQVFAPGS